MFQLTVEESIATLILLEDLIENVEDAESVLALEYVHDTLDSQMLSSFGLNVEEQVDQEVFKFLNENSKAKVNYDVDELVVDILKALFVPMLEDEEMLTPQGRMQVAKILFKIS